MKDVQKMIEMLTQQISWKQEELRDELEYVADVAQENRGTSYYLADLERAMNVAKKTQESIRELEIKLNTLKYILEG